MCERALSASWPMLIPKCVVTLVPVMQNVYVYIDIYRCVDHNGAGLVL